MVGDKKNYPMIGLKVLIIALLAVFFLVPFWLVITGSFTEEFTFIKNGYSFGIGKFSIAAYQFIFENEHVMRALLNRVRGNGNTFRYCEYGDGIYACGTRYARAFVLQSVFRIYNVFQCWYGSYFLGYSGNRFIRFIVGTYFAWRSFGI